MAALLRQLDFHGEELAIADKELAVQALTDPVVARLMTIPGVDAIAAISVVAAAGDFSRFAEPGKLVAYVGLNPRIRQRLSHSCGRVVRWSRSGPQRPSEACSPSVWCSVRGSRRQSREHFFRAV